MLKKIIIFLIFMVMIVLAVIFIGGDKKTDVCQGDDCVVVVEPEDEVVITSPMPNEVVSETIIIQGKARGFWFFEATMPIKLLATDGEELAIGFVEATSNWMTEDYTPFKGELKFVMPSGAESGVLVFNKANASGLPEFDGSFEVPVRFK